MVRPEDIAVADGDFFLRVLIVLQNHVRHCSGEADDHGASNFDGVELLLSAVCTHPVKIQNTSQPLLIRQCLGQERRGFVDVFGDAHRAVARVFAVADVEEVMHERQYLDLVQVGGLAFIADGVLRGATCGDEALHRSRDGHVRLVGHF